MRSRRVSIGSLSEPFGEPMEWDSATDDHGAGSRGSGRSFTGRRDWNRWGRRTLVVVAVFAGVVVTGLIAANALIDSEATSAWAAERASAALNRTVSVADARVALFPRPGLRLDGVRVAAGLAADEGPLAVIDRVHLGVSVPRLLIGSVRLTRADLDRLDVHLAVNEHGLTNFGDFVPQGASLAAAGSGRISLALRQIRFSDAMVSYFDARTGRSFALADMGGAVHVASDSVAGWRATGSGSADSLHLRIPTVRDDILRTRGPAYEVTLRGSSGSDEVEIVEGRFGRGELAVTFAGALSGLSGTEPRMDVRVANQKLPADALTTLLSTDMRSSALPVFEGTLDLGLALRGPLDGDMRRLVRGAVRLDEVGLRLAGEPIAEGISGVVRVGADVVALDSLRGGLAGGTVAMSAAVRHDARTFVMSVEASPKLAMLERAGLLPDGTSLAGEASAELRMEGSIDALHEASVAGVVHLSGVKTEVGRINAPIYLAAGDFQLTAEGVSWLPLRVLLGEEPVDITGSMQGRPADWIFGEGVPELAVTVNAERLDLDALFGREGGEAPSYPQIVFAQLRGADVGGTRAPAAARAAGLSRPDRLPAHGTVDLVTSAIRWNGIDLGGVEGRFAMSPEAFKVEQLVFGGFDGSVSLSLLMGIGNGMDEPFELALGVEDADARALLRSLGHDVEDDPASGGIDGRVDLWTEVAGTLDLFLLPFPASLTARGDVTVREGRVGSFGLNHALADFLADDAWSEVPFETWGAGFEVHEQRVDVSRSELNGELGSVVASGSVGFGSALDLEMALTVPPDRLGSVSLRRTGVAQSMIERLRTSGTPLELGVRVSGTLAGPELEPDALAAEPRTPGGS